MIVKILTPSATFEGVDYNERKVSKGVADLLEIKNFGYLQSLGDIGSTPLRKYLMDYSAKNDRIKNTQFHISISCKGDECTHEQLVKFAHQWLDKMGYGKDGQPLLIYGHHDTDNNHIHIVTSRVDPMGNKIDHNFERERSQKFIEEILGENRQERLDKNIVAALSYNFENVSQFKAVLEASGYECYDKDEELFIKRSGVVQGKLKLKDIEGKQKSGYLTKERKKQLKAILTKYRDMASDKAELRDMMKEKFGIDIIFVGSKDNPYGYMLVDHKNKAVFKGSSILPIKQLLVFQDKQERLRRMDMFIDVMLKDSSMLTTRQLNKMLRRQFSVHISKGNIIVGKDKVQLPDYILKALERNDKCAWLQSFHPRTEEERDVLCMFGKVEDKELVKVEKDTSKDADKLVATIHDILDNNTGKEAYAQLRDAAITVIRQGDEYFCIDLKNRLVLKASDYELDMSALKSHVKGKVEGKETKRGEHAKTIHPKTAGKAQIANDLKNLGKGQGGNASGANREWEVGTHGGYDDIDDERTLKR